MQNLTKYLLNNIFFNGYLDTYISNYEEDNIHDYNNQDDEQDYDDI